MNPNIKKLIVNKPLDLFKDTIFISAGDSQVFATYVTENLRSQFNIILFFYGKNIDVLSKMQWKVNIILIGDGTKFNALKYIYDKGLLGEVSGYVWVSDDDLVVSSFDAIARVFRDMRLFQSELATPSHSRRGRISFKDMRRHPLSTGVRESNFVEMTCPIFSVNFLRVFLSQYDYSLAGWGTDYWFSWCARSRGVRILIFDYISVLNPCLRNDGRREIDCYMSSDQRSAQWECRRKLLEIDNILVESKEIDLGISSRFKNLRSFIFYEFFHCLVYLLKGKRGR